VCISWIIKLLILLMHGCNHEDSVCESNVRILQKTQQPLLVVSPEVKQLTRVLIINVLLIIHFFFNFWKQ